eukprot:TRINITY_DN3115_c0_g1_i2.p1 TRINITY_DN3115_c0_g1~~TRINITY_DN3115_c0_g1_i2.p1  ORF type:complete len:117 (-),score=19.75 TRINITY_DN3115_c0_g1_i2:110-460(-)
MQYIYKPFWQPTLCTEPPETIVCLDEGGKTFKNSEQFSNWFFKRLELNQRTPNGDRINFVIGSAEGFPKTIWLKKYETISLSPLTLTHQMTRVLLLEQIYRSFEMSKGKPYHRGKE